MRGGGLYPTGRAGARFWAACGSAAPLLAAPTPLPSPDAPLPLPPRLAELLQSGSGGGDAEAGSHLGGLVAGGGRKKTVSPSVRRRGRARYGHKAGGGRGACQGPPPAAAAAACPCLVRPDQQPPPWTPPPLTREPAPPRRRRAPAQLPSADSVEYWRSPEKEGWLHSQGDVVKTWRKRWFVLKQGYLFRFMAPGPTGAVARGRAEAGGGGGAPAGSGAAPRPRGARRRAPPAHRLSWAPTRDRH